MTEKLALHGGRPLVRQPLPHFRWPPPVPGLAGATARYIEAFHKVLSRLEELK